MATYCWLQRLDFALRKFTKFSVFLALKYTPITGLTEITELNRKKERKGQVRAFSDFFVTTEVRAGLLFTSLKLQKPAKFERREQRPFEIDI